MKRGNQKLSTSSIPFYLLNLKPTEHLAVEQDCFLFLQEHGCGLPSDLLFQEAIQTFPPAWYGEEIHGVSHRGFSSRVSMISQTLCSKDIIKLSTFPHFEVKSKALNFVKGLKLAPLLTR